jgi:hypothetical protein
MCCHRRCLFNYICVNHVNNDNIHQGLEINYGDKDIHSLSNVAREKVGNLPLNMCSILQTNSYDNIPKCIMGYYTFIPIGAPKQMDT